MKKAVLALSAILFAVGTGAAYSPGSYLESEHRYTFDNGSDFDRSHPDFDVLMYDGSIDNQTVSEGFNFSSSFSGTPVFAYDHNSAKLRGTVEAGEVDGELEVKIAGGQTFGWLNQTGDTVEFNAPATDSDLGISAVSGYGLIDSVTVKDVYNRSFDKLWSEEKIKLAESETSNVFEASKINLFRVNASVGENDSAEAVVKRYDDVEKIGEETFNVTDGHNEFNLSTGNASSFEVVVKASDGEVEIHDLLIDGKTTGYTPIISPTGGFFGGVTGFFDNIIGGAMDFVGGVFSAATGWIPFL